MKTTKLLRGNAARDDTHISPKKRGRRSHEPTDQTRQQVAGLVLAKTEQVVIAEIIGIAEKTLRKHYRRELDFSIDQVSVDLTLAIYKKAVGRDTKACKRWLKRKAGWFESVMSQSGVETLELVFEEKPADWKAQISAAVEYSHADEKRKPASPSIAVKADHERNIPDS